MELKELQKIKKIGNTIEIFYRGREDEKNFSKKGVIKKIEALGEIQVVHVEQINKKVFLLPLVKEVANQIDKIILST